MRTRFEKLCLRLQRLFILGFCLAAGSPLASGAVIQPLHSFGQKGTTPMLTLARDEGLYGTIPTGGTYGYGAVYRVTPDGQYTLVYSFTGQEDGSNPGTTLMQASDGNFYGTTVVERPAQVGTVFRISTNGVLTTLFRFTGGNDGRNAAAGLIEGNDHYLYGTTPGGGATDKGTLFRISMNGDFTTLYSFTGGDDGATPLSGLVPARDGSFFGLASTGGPYFFGTIFRITTNGTFTTLYQFTGGDDGGGPSGLVLAADGNLYGTTIAHGSGQNGTVFQLSTNGTLTTLYAFTHGGDGAEPARLLQASNGNLYGITATDGVFGFGTIFRITTSGTLTTVYVFHGGNEGAYPNGVLHSDDGFLYGTTQGGGAGGVGIAFRLSVDGSLTPLHAFEGGNGSGRPNASLLQASDGLLYGATYGGAFDFGTLFRITTNGLFSALYQFRGWTDGGYPTAGLLQASDRLFYGTTYYSANTDGTVYQFNPDAGLTTLYSFPVGAEGDYPQGRLVQTGGNLYGTTAGGYGSSGSVFGMTTNGSLTTLHTFNGTNDGASPIAGLTLASDSALYGTTQSGGASDYGTVFRITTNGSFETVYSFSGGDDGGRPTGALIQTSDGNLYGTTYGVGFGSVFRLTTNDVLTTVHSFTGTIDGANPRAGLMQGPDGNLYGTTACGGPDSDGQPFAGNGSVFRMTTQGELTTLHFFTGGNDGGNPCAELILASDGSLYGTTASGGALGFGTVFRILPELSDSPPVVIRTGFSGGRFSLSFQTLAGQSYTIEASRVLPATVWDVYTNFIGDGSLFQLSLPVANSTSRFFRVRQP